MELKPLGQSGLQVSRLGLGLAALGRPGYINLGHGRDLNGDYAVAAMRAHAHQVLDAAWDAGIRYFDAARSYGRAEAFLGSWLRARQIAPEAVSVGSKWGYTYTAGWQVEAEVHEVKEHTLPVLQRQVRESRAELGDYLDLYQIHSATLDSGVLENQPVLEALAELKAGGLRLGLSLSGPQQARTLWRALEVPDGRGGCLFDAVQATWNLLEPSASVALLAAYQAGLGIIVKEALANGRLTPRNDGPEVRPLAEAAERLHATMDALALAAALAQPWAGVVLSGATTAAQLSSNTAALALRWSDALAQQLQVLAEPPDTYWETRRRLPWN